jgi:hypothetical protein
MSEPWTNFIPGIGFVLIVGVLVWIGFSRAARIRARAYAQGEAYLKAMDRSNLALERIAAALEARNQNTSPGIGKEAAN